MRDRGTAALKALREIKELIGRPVGLAEKLEEWSIKLDLNERLSVSEVIELLQPNSRDAYFRQYFHGMIAHWDYRPEVDWCCGTKPSSAERRKVICDLLMLSHTEAEKICRVFPVYPSIDQPIRITDDDPSAASWYSEHRRDQNSFYWRSYERYLLQEKGWNSKNVAVLDSTSTDVVSDMKDPLGSDARTTRGLVVGYVQSGKTANFTGVVAKAIDAGYRLVIVLGGLQNTLRNQTQRRLDKELVGREILAASGHEYDADSDWADFNRHGEIPERSGAFNIDRLTTSDQDFRHPIGDLSRLRFHKADPSLPFNDPRNLGRHPAKLVVIKKNKAPLTHLLSALSQAQSAGTAWCEVPSIMIDDESDQASLNSRKPTTSELRERTAINGLIVKILTVLQRCQYVGYTATPFANVFVNPDDAEDLFPSNFISSLPRPEGYMGVQDFYDDRDTPKKCPDPATNFGCYVRPVEGDDIQDDNLPRAIDAFVLSGAIKLFRQHRDGRKYKHHTMLVHLTTSVKQHRQIKVKIDSLFEAAGYATGGDGFARLRQLWKSDFQKICAGGRHDDGAVPRDFTELRPFIGDCVARIAADGGCTLILNGDDRENPPDFDKSAVWKIIVGGAKLSRGYTVEGLTVSYYRRVAGAADTLMQMGRWFGYRDGYRDLVRLYIGTDEPKGRKERIDLYEAFRGVCDDEEEFRSQIRLYSRLQGEERLTPKQIPPLVPSHMLLPTAKNKMYNATVLFINFGGQQKQGTIASNDPRIKESNEKAMARLLVQSGAAERALARKSAEGSVAFRAYAGSVAPDGMKKFLHAYRFGATVQDQEQLRLIREYVEGQHGNPLIDRWVIIAPQFANEVEGEGWRVDGIGDLSIRRRERVGTEQRRYNVFTESRHVAFAEMIAGFDSSAVPDSPDAAQLMGARTGVMLVYPVLARSEAGEIPTMGFSLFFPPNEINRRIRYGVRVKDRPGDVIVDAST